MTTCQEWTVGGVRIRRVMEIPALDIPGTVLLPDATPEAVRTINWLVPDFATAAGNFLFSFQSFLVLVDGLRIIIDTCIGNHKANAVPPIHLLDTGFLDSLAEAGAPAATVDIVLCTHLHFDHVGWNTRLQDGKWVPTFPNARYLFGKDEWNHARLHEPHEGSLNDHIAQSVTPIFEAGLVDLIDTDHRIGKSIRLVHSPGHTPGHVSVWIESNSESAVISGDMFHHPIQCAHPNMGSNFCFDPNRANATRLAFLRQIANTDTLLIGSHFAGPTAGYVVGSRDSWKLDVHHRSEGTRA